MITHLTQHTDISIVIISTETARAPPDSSGDRAPVAESAQRVRSRKAAAADACGTASDVAN